MTREIQPRPSHTAIVPEADPLVPVIAAATPTLTAIQHLRPCVDWVAAIEKGPRFLLNVRRPLEFGEEAERRLRLIPPLATLERAAKLFEEAERVPAPEPLLHLALGAMLAERPNAGKVTAAWRRGIVDSLLHDDEYAPGPSAPVLIKMIRELRKATEFVPTPSEVLESCKRQRQHLADLQFRVGQLIALRENAEQVLAEEQRLIDAEDWGDERVTPLPADQRPKHDDADLPF